MDNLNKVYLIYLLEGNQLSFKDFEDIIQQMNWNVDFKTNILPAMKEYVYHSMSSVKKKINPDVFIELFEFLGQIILL